MAEAGKALSVTVACGAFLININTDNVQVARDVCKTITEVGESTRDVARYVGITAVSLGALYLGYTLVRPLIETAVTRGLGGERDDQEVRDIRPGSLHVLLHCFTDERVLQVLADYESGRMKQRLQKEFSHIGIKVQGLKVEIENMAEVNKTKEGINKRYARCFIKNISRAPRVLNFRYKNFQMVFILYLNIIVPRPWPTRCKFLLRTDTNECILYRNANIVV